MHSAPPDDRVKTRVFRDCRFPENRRPVLPPRVPRAVVDAPQNPENHAFTEENTYQKPPFPGLTGNLV
jgi:hypothetical protein